MFECAIAQERSPHPLVLLKNDSAHVFASYDRSSLSADHLPPIDLLRMPSPYSYQHLGIFCKAEVKMNKWFPLPVMFRLGDVERAEDLDGKGAFRATH